MKPRRWKILIVWLNGEREFVKEGSAVKVFLTRRAAQEMAEFMRMGFDKDDVQSINVVPA